MLKRLTYQASRSDFFISLPEVIFLPPHLSRYGGTYKSRWSILQLRPQIIIFLSSDTEDGNSKMKTIHVLWDATPWWLANSCRRFERTQCLHLQDQTEPVSFSHPWMRRLTARLKRNVADCVPFNTAYYPGGLQAIKNTTVRTSNFANRRFLRKVNILIVEQLRYRAEVTPSLQTNLSSDHYRHLPRQSEPNNYSWNAGFRFQPT